MSNLTSTDLAILAGYLCVLILPGLLVAHAAGARGWVLACAAPVTAYGIVAVFGPLSDSLGMSWGLGWLAAASLLLAVPLYVLRQYCASGSARRLAWSSISREEGSPPATILTRVGLGAAVAAGGVIGGMVVLAGIGDLGRVNQDWDMTFHANAVRFIGDTGHADPGALKAINHYEQAGFYYPNAYHVLAATVVDATSDDIPRALNGHSLLLPGLTALGVAGLAVTFNLRPAVAGTAAILSACFSSFPYDLIWRGPILPYATALALLGSFFVLMGWALDRPQLPGVLLVALGAVGLVAVHPSAAFLAAPLTACLIAQRVAARSAVTRWTGATRDMLLVGAVVVAAAILGLAHVNGAFSSPAFPEVDWPAENSVGAAFGELLLLNHARSSPQWFLAALLVVGLCSFRALRPVAWWLAGGVVFSALFVVAAAYEGSVAAAVTRPWWNDKWRLVAAATPMLAIVAAQGLVVLRDAARVRMRPRLDSRWSGRPAAPAMALLAALGAFGALTVGFYGPENADRVAIKYVEGPTLSTVERDSMTKLASLVPSGARVMNDPRDGSPWMYALQGVHPMFGHVVGDLDLPTLSRGQQRLLLRFNDLDTDRVVQELVQRYDIQYVYLGSGYVRPTFERFAGLRDLDRVRSLRLVYSNDATQIYRVSPPPTSSNEGAVVRSSVPG